MKFDIGDLYKSCSEVNSGSCLNTVILPLHEAEEFCQSYKKLNIVQKIVREYNLDPIIVCCFYLKHFLVYKYLITYKEK
jgi:hypothetical protein